jgi:hypothetical protein
VTRLDSRSDADRLRPRRLLVAIAAGSASALAIGVPTDVIDTGLFVRMTDVRWWEYPVLVLTALLTALWAASPRHSCSKGSSGGARIAGSTVLSALAIGCPVCNKLVVAALGVSGTLGAWAPVQPFVAVGSLVMVSLAVLSRRRACSGQCAATNSAAPVCAPGPTP